MASAIFGLSSQVLAAALIGMVIGSALTGGFMALEGMNISGYIEDMIDQKLEPVKDMPNQLSALGGEIGVKIDESVYSGYNEMENFMEDRFKAINDKVDKLSTTLSEMENRLRGDHLSILESLDEFGSLLASIDSRLNSLSQSIDGLLESLAMLELTLNNLENNLNSIVDSLETALDSLLASIEELSLSLTNIESQLESITDLISTSLSNIETLLTELQLSIDQLQQSIDEVISILNELLLDLNQLMEGQLEILAKLDKMDAKLQKQVEIDMGEREWNTDDPIKRFFLLASLQGDGGMPNTRVVRAEIIGYPDVPVSVTPGEIPGYFDIDVDTTFLPPGVYQLYVEVEIDLPLPDGTTQTFKGRQVFNVWVW